MSKNKTPKTSKTSTTTNTGATNTSDPLLSAVANKARELGLSVDVADESVSKALDAHKRRQVSTLLSLADPNAARLRKAQALQKLNEASDSDVLLARASARIKETIARGTALASLSETETLRYEAARELLRSPKAKPKTQPETAPATEATETIKATEAN